MRVAIAAALIALPGLAAANPLDEYGFGARAIGLQGAVTAVADDFSATYYNAAGLATGDALRVEFGYAFADPRLDIDGERQEVDGSRGLQGGMVIPGELWGRRVAFSLGLYVPSDRLSRIRALPQSTPRFTLYDNRTQRLFITVAAAVEVVEGLYVGAGLTSFSGTKGTLDLVGEVNATSADRTTLLAGVDVRLSAARYPSAGLVYIPNDRWRFALSYREEFILRLDLGVRVDGDITVGAEDLVLVEDGSFVLDYFNRGMFSPRQVSLGVAHTVGGIQLSMDVAWQQWSRFPPSAGNIDLELDLEGLDFTVPTSDRPLAPGFHDIVVFRAGVEVPLLDTEYVDVLGRAGYHYQPSPAPEQPGLTNYADASRQGLGVGLSLTLDVLPSILPRPLVIDAAAQMLTLNRRRFVKQAAPNYSIGGRVYGGAVTARLLF